MYFEHRNIKEEKVAEARWETTHRFREENNRAAINDQNLQRRKRDWLKTLDKEREVYLADDFQDRVQNFSYPKLIKGKSSKDVLSESVPRNKIWLQKAQARKVREDIKDIQLNPPTEEEKRLQQKEKRRKSPPPRYPPIKEPPQPHLATSLIPKFASESALYLQENEQVHRVPPSKSWTPPIISKPTPKVFEINRVNNHLH